MTHILLIILICVLIFGPHRLTGVTRSLGEGLRQFKKGLRGEADIDVTNSVKRLDDED
jgi:sec-independent protein translocase protein TatA